MISNLKRRALHRSKVIQGQARGLEKMIANEEYCLDIITQSLAVQKSLRSLNKLILENHLKTHVIERMKKSGVRSKNKSIQELLNIYDLSIVRS